MRNHIFENQRHKTRNKKLTFFALTEGKINKKYAPKPQFVLKIKYVAYPYGFTQLNML